MAQDIAHQILIVDCSDRQPGKRRERPAECPQRYTRKCEVVGSSWFSGTWGQVWLIVCWPCCPGAGLTRGDSTLISSLMISKSSWYVATAVVLWRICLLNCIRRLQQMSRMARRSGRRTKLRWWPRGEGRIRRNIWTVHPIARCRFEFESSYSCEGSWGGDHQSNAQYLGSEAIHPKATS